jgi:hypothetical protein
MAHFPVDVQSDRSHLSEKPSLPSFSNFISGTGRPDLGFVPPCPAHNLGDSRQSRPIRSEGFPPFQHNLTQPNVHVVSEQSPPLYPEVITRPHGFHLEQNQGSFWPFSKGSPRKAASILSEHLPQEPQHGFAYTRPVTRDEDSRGNALYHRFEDSSVSQRNVNGDPLNPKWGTTKAGKPRKRLGQACNTCREKKIKCDPSVPKCAQCQKFNRDCKFETT